MISLAAQQFSSQGSRSLDQRQVLGQIAKAKRRQTALLLAEQFAWAAQLQIFLGNAKTIRCFLQCAETLAGLGRFDGGQKDAVGIVRAPADPASELMKLGQPKLLGILD